jgi:hypothetical protein
VKRSVHAALLGALVACSAPNGGDDAGEPVSEEGQALNGTLTTNGNLTRARFNQPDESLRESDTQEYYRTASIASDGRSGSGTIRTAIPTLARFISYYQLGGRDEVRAHYYNRGDLGLGREMHCVDKLRQQVKEFVACYVKNFAAGDRDGEFTFGGSPDVAFANMASGAPFATVGMVFRPRASGPNRVLFVVYDADGNLANVAPLDRHGQNFQNAFVANGRTNPDPSLFGVPGRNFNNHIPTNCLSCHSGRYDSAARAVTGGVFLPFDLDQFEFENAPGRTRADQLDAFRLLNEMVRRVAALSQSPAGDSVAAQLDLWYQNQVSTNVRAEVFENAFDSSAVPEGWAAEPHLYRSVIRRVCRNCHVAVSATFDFASEARFLGPNGTNAMTYANLLCRYEMPHALQTVREFWQSPAPSELEGYFRRVGQTAAADALHRCGPGDVATLDPHLIAASLPPP